MSNPLISVDADIFNLTNESEGIEGFKFDENTVTIINPGDMIEKIDNENILDFLNCPATKVFIKRDESGEAMTKMIAHNYVSNETIEITNLGDHIIAMNEVLLEATNTRKKLKNNPNAQIISNEMIENINALLLFRRTGEAGIGEYRDYLHYPYDHIPCNVSVGFIDAEGNKTLIDEWQPEPGGKGRIRKLMNELVDWANSEEFRQMDPLKRAIIFHARFIKIHPFRDGNGRTGRMILNYMLAISKLPLTNIRDTSSDEYLAGITQAIAYNNYDLLTEVVKKNQIRYGRELYSAIMQYNKARNTHLRINGSQIKGLTHTF